mmetsp:Transcript_21584/g.50809  ORF Transcript_21584/g.50809 Transcript_21584/m.50809 type:complete len:247 (-) Transcript_21584:412-1152(-)
MRLPGAVSHGSDRNWLASAPDCQVLMKTCSSCKQNTGHVSPIDRRIRQGHPNQAGDRRQDVQRGDDLSRHARRGNATGPPRNRWLSNTTFPGAAFASIGVVIVDPGPGPSEQTRAATLNILGEPRAVIRGKHDQRVVGQPQRVKLREDLPSDPVHLASGITKGAAGRFAEKVRAGVLRPTRHTNMNVGEGNIEEKRRVLVLFDERCGRVCVGFREGLHVHRLLNNGLVMQKRQIWAGLVSTVTMRG